MHSPGLVNIVTALLALPAAFTQSGGLPLAKPCILNYLCCLCHISSIGNSMWGDGSLYMFHGVWMSSMIARLVQSTRRMSSGFDLL